MKKLSLIAIALAVLPILSSFAFAVVIQVPIGAAPGNSNPVVKLINKTITVDGINVIPLRPGFYGFNGEIITVAVIVRDDNGASDISGAVLKIQGVQKVICSLAENPQNGLFSSSITNGFQPLTDKVFVCRYTIEPQTTQQGSKTLDIVATDATGGTGTYNDPWFLNPAITIATSFNTGTALTFEAGTAGETVFSTNALIVKNTAEGGAFIWAFLAGSDVFSTNPNAICPTTNALDIKRFDYRAVSGTRTHDFSVMPEYDQNIACNTGTCRADIANGIPLTVGDDPDNIDRILGNGLEVELWFRLRYPTPCQGSFTNGQLYLTGEAV